MLDICIPASPNDVLAWLRPIGRDWGVHSWQINMNALSVSLGCIDLPLETFSAEAQREVRDTFDVFPRVGELVRFLHVWAADHGLILPKSSAIPQCTTAVCQNAIEVVL